jgi:hypothetical protein
MFLMDQISSANRAQVSMERKLEIFAIKQRLLNEVDCANTLAGVNPASDCTPWNYLNLRNSSNASVTGAAGTGVLLNSLLLENKWYIRTTCDSASVPPSLVVRAAREGSSSATFGQDPSTGFVFDWAYAKGLLFGPTATTLCSQQLGGAGPPPGAWKVGDLAAGGACQSNMMQDDDGNDSYGLALYSGTVLCNPGQNAVAGSVDCGAGGASRLQHSHVNAAGNGWTGACCPDGAFVGTGKIKVLCQ